MCWTMKAFVGAMVMSMLGVAHSQQPIKILHQFAPSANFAIALTRFTEPLSQELKRPVIFEGHSGAGGAVMMNAYQNQGDTNTFLIAGTNPYLVIPMVQRVDYRTDDLEPLALFAMSPMCYAARGDSRELDFRKFIAQHRGGFYASLGNATIEALLLESINKTENLGQTGINYKSYAEISASLLRGDTQWSIVPRNLCTGLDSRAQQNSQQLVEIRNVPANLDPSYWFGLFGKRNVDRRVLDTVTNAFVTAWLRERDNLSRTVFYPDRVIRGEEFRKFIDQDRAKWANLVRK